MEKNTKSDLFTTAFCFICLDRNKELISRNEYTMNLYRDLIMPELPSSLHDHLFEFCLDCALLLQKFKNFKTTTKNIIGTVELILRNRTMQNMNDEPEMNVEVESDHSNQSEILHEPTKISRVNNHRATDDKIEHSCSYCKAAFAQKNCWLIHMIEKHPEKHQCLDCGKVLNDEISYTDHILREHGYNLTMLKYLCPSLQQSHHDHQLLSNDELQTMSIPLL